MRKWADDVKIFSPKRIYRLQKPHEKRLNIISHHGMQIIATVRHHHTRIRIIRMKIAAPSNTGKDVKELDHSEISGRNVKWYKTI